MIILFLLFLSLLYCYITIFLYDSMTPTVVVIILAVILLLLLLFPGLGSGGWAVGL